MGNNKYNMIGKKFNRLMVLEECKDRTKDNHKHTYILFGGGDNE